MDQSNVNPYQSPMSVDRHRPSLAPKALQALRYVRQAVGVLLAPAIVNGTLIATGAGPFFPLAAFANLVLVGMVAAGFWFFGLVAINFAALMFYGVLGGPLAREAWLDRTYESLWPLPWAAGAGAAIWFVWVVLFFGPNHLSLPATLVLGALAHVAAAWVYLSVFTGWYRLRREAMPR